MPVRRTFVFVALLLGTFVVTGLVSPALADQRDISVGGVFICRLTHDSAGVTSYVRATEVNRRITQVLSTPKFRQGAVIAVRQYGASAIITVGDMLVFTVTPEDAAGTPVTPMQLAKQWAGLLAQGLSRALPDSTFHF